MLCRIALFGEHALLAFEGSADKEVSVLAKADSNEGDRQLALSWAWLAREGAIFSDEGSIER